MAPIDLNLGQNAGSYVSVMVVRQSNSMGQSKILHSFQRSIQNIIGRLISLHRKILVMTSFRKTFFSVIIVLPFVIVDIPSSIDGMPFVMEEEILARRLFI